MSAKYCGCDVEAGWECDQHRGELERLTRKVEAEQRRQRMCENQKAQEQTRAVSEPERQRQALDRLAHGGAVGQGTPGRETARSLLNRRINEAYARGRNLEALAMALPMELPPAADEALWAMLVAMR